MAQHLSRTAHGLNWVRWISRDTPVGQSVAERGQPRYSCRPGV